MANSLTRSDQAEARRHSAPAVSLFVLAAGFAVYAVFAPRWLEPVYEQFNGDMSSASLFETIGFQVWLVALPLAAISALVGGLLVTRANRGRAWLFGVGGLALVIVPIAAAVFVGRTYGWFFGTGGAVIAALVLMTGWSWAGMRSRLPADRCLVSDLRMAGYTAFAFASWFTCGVFAIPVYALDPSKMIAFDTTALAMPMAYAMMTFFVAGWILTYAAQNMERRNMERRNSVSPSEVVHIRERIGAR